MTYRDKAYTGFIKPLVSRARKLGHVKRFAGGNQTKEKDKPKKKGPTLPTPQLRDPLAGRRRKERCPEQALPVRSQTRVKGRRGKSSRRSPPEANKGRTVKRKQRKDIKKEKKKKNENTNTKQKQKTNESSLISNVPSRRA